MLINQLPRLSLLRPRPSTSRLLSSVGPTAAIASLRRRSVSNLLADSISESCNDFSCRCRSAPQRTGLDGTGLDWTGLDSILTF